MLAQRMQAEEKPAGILTALLSRLERLTVPPLARGVFIALLGLYLAVARSYDLAVASQIEGDQIRDWTIALGSWRDLPLAGTPSVMGGATFGPVFYWTLWGIRHLVGPWTDNLPHAGGLGLAGLQTAADMLLCAVLWRRTSSLTLAVATVMLLATAPHDLALSGTIWNPPLAVALVKAALALRLAAGDRTSIAWVIGTVTTAWLAVQAHSSAVFVAVPVLASFPLQHAFGRRWRHAFQSTRTIVEVVAVLQLPYLVSLIADPGGPAGPTRFLASVWQTLGDPDTLRLGASSAALASHTGRILTTPWPAPGFAGVLAAAALVTAVRARRDLSLAAVTVLPLASAAGGFALWQEPFEEYWYLTMVPSAAMTLAWAITAWPRAATATSGALLVLVLAVQPMRLASAATRYRMPEYEALVSASRQILRYTGEVAAITTEFPLPPTTDPTFLYRVLGGRISPDARFTASIGRDGDATFVPATR